MGLSDELIEILFVHPDEQGKGYGKQLMQYALHEKHIYKVDVNEQNEKAHRFYLHMGFQLIGRDETDPSGNHFSHFTPAMEAVDEHASYKTKTD